MGKVIQQGKISVSNSKSMYVKLLMAVAVGIIIWFIPTPAGVKTNAWHMFAIFVATIIGCILKPLPIGAVSMIGLTITAATNTATIKVALSGFSQSSIWLIVMAFFISRGFIKTGLGSRIAYEFVRLFGKKTLGLCYSVLFCDLAIAPATPSNTARAGGIVYPIVKSLSESFNSRPEDGTERKIGSFLIFSEFHGDIITSAMFMTAMAANPLAQTLAESLNVHITWFGWFLAALLPGIICFILVPLIIYKIYPPEIKATPNAPEIAKEQLKKMGPLTKEEKYMALIFIITLLLWVTGTITKIDATLTAFIGLSLLLLLNVLNWNDIKSEKGAWDTLVWFSVLVMMANELNELGFIPWFSKLIAGSVAGLSWQVILLVLILAYFYSHYIFASATAHVSAMYSAFLAVAIAGGIPPMLAALTLGFFGNLFASTTHYSNGPAPLLFGSGYVSQNKWWSLNFILGIFYIVVWLGIGPIWCHIIGVY
ncbi:anion permease [Clostridium luticellarii]|uniref:Putative malate transporter YflS n=2 Tax=Clostridium luticellarii TaxID=1691940 RepID=A0A2T0BQB5_9CLOT|nr:anion permease [Clostridium luticellarii]MCI1967927.1 anion permease [Clostridium luticellarii]MCI1995134.1 anion permease [Clostridium luticellarii]PRR86073.1 putative malate transporter YflS [Clostridium luticellarii]